MNKRMPSTASYPFLTTKTKAARLKGIRLAEQSNAILKPLNRQPMTHKEKQ